ncbi:DUF4238 domain-containing protein [Pedobacter sp. WC2501]|uniref:DUF4238 domain-containing protein n=1 Tax=Pedobacter sp. WC2501 TaxID=3461400 RepID=UPI004045CE8E
MAYKKKQHYISQFLLKNFSNNGERKYIHLFDRDSGRHVSNAPISTQAQSDYFYGSDLAFEEYLGMTEDRTAPILKDILAKLVIPNFDDKSYRYLLHFIALYQWRTKASVKHTEDYINNSLKSLSEYDVRLKEIDFNKYRLKHSEPAAFNLASFMDMWVVAADLEAFLLVNHTRKDFIISDNPLVIFNPFMQARKRYWNANNTINKGLILLFTISPSCCLMFLDRQTYDVRANESNQIHVFKASDVYNVNLLQSVSADSILYFSDEDQRRYIESIALEGKKNKKAVFISELVPCPDKPTVKCMFSYQLEHKLSLGFSFVREGEEARKYDVNKSFDHIRTPEIRDWISRENIERLKRNRDGGVNAL